MTAFKLRYKRFGFNLKYDNIYVQYLSKAFSLLPIKETIANFICLLNIDYIPCF